MGSKVTDQNVAWINLVLRKFYVGTLSTVSKCFSMNRRAEKQIFKLQGTSQALWTKLCSMKWQLQSQLMLHRVLCGCILCITKDNFQSHEQCSSPCFFPQELKRVPAQVLCLLPESLAATLKTRGNWMPLNFCGLCSCPLLRAASMAMEQQ